MNTDTKPMTVAELVVSAAELPFCRSKEDDKGWLFPCGLEVGGNTLMAEGEEANSVTESVRFIHAKHHIDGHVPLYGVWTFVARLAIEGNSSPTYKLWCSCQDELDDYSN